MDIMVTTPKSETNIAKKEGEFAEKNDGHWFRVFKFKPDIEIGDRIYFVNNGRITGYGKVIYSPYQSEDGERCEVTDRVWGKEGDWVLEYGDWRWLHNPIKFKGFQGIRYVSRLPDSMRNMIIKETRDKERR